ncbi:GNAT family N-acetyltransferase [Chitinophaga sp. SYP-B3965]|uniref:GNAT family N-acetyltransferase n=1 Tax=Chitinophaga sp. SYP-B3965 TaxID=2663120 RepID=UPI001299F0F6|nr:GNAT family N-acetyltransferase [Chitinophaga sp. SYP-B3965]MRG44766.1 GNAT family N-acetyltransferase [Chitinophaga sp. SYP-B3965]
MLTLNFDPYPILTTQRLVLRKLRESDADEVLYLRSHKDIMQYIPRPLQKDRDDAIKFIRDHLELTRKNEAINWAITIPGEDKVIGMIGLFNVEPENFRCEVGYLLHDNWHGKGIMTEALPAVLDHSFRVLKFHSIAAVIDPGNIASAKLLEKNNFTKEAHFKENMFYEGRFMDAIIYSLLTPFR